MRIEGARLLRIIHPSTDEHADEFRCGSSFFSERCSYRGMGTSPRWYNDTGICRHFLDAIASTCSYPCQSVSGSLIVSDVAITSTELCELVLKTDFDYFYFYFYSRELKQF